MGLLADANLLVLTGADSADSHAWIIYAVINLCA